MFSGISRIIICILFLFLSNKKNNLLIFCMPENLKPFPTLALKCVTRMFSKSNTIAEAINYKNLLFDTSYIPQILRKSHG